MFDKVVLLSSSKRSPPADLQRNVGEGSPDALHDKDTFCPSMAVWVERGSMDGGTANKGK